MPSTRLVIFDVDGTLIDESSRLQAQTDAVAWKFGETIEQRQLVVDAFFAANDQAQALQSTGDAAVKGDIPWYMRQIGQSLNIAVSDAESEKLALEWHAAYTASHGEPHLFEDSLPVLQTLRDSGFEMVVASGNTVATRKQLLIGAGIQDFFSTIFAAIDVGYQKQDVRFWQALLESVDTDPSRIAMIGNQINDDIIHPAALGMKTFLVERADTLRKNLGLGMASPDFTVQSLMEIPVHL